MARLRLRLPEHIAVAQGASNWPAVTVALEACGVAGHLEITPAQLVLPQPLHVGQVTPIICLNGFFNAIVILSELRSYERKHQHPFASISYFDSIGSSTRLCLCQSSSLRASSQLPNQILQAIANHHKAAS